MQSLPVSAVVSQVSASGPAANGVAGGDSGDLTETADFGALLEQQVNGIAALYQLAGAELSTAVQGSDPAGKKIPLARAADDSSIQAVELGAADLSLMAPPVLPAPIAPIDAKLQMLPSTGVAGVAGNKLSDPSLVSGALVDAHAEKLATAMSDRGKIVPVEFAVDGNFLPRTAGGKMSAEIAGVTADFPRDHQPLDAAAGLPRIDAFLPVQASTPATHVAAANVAPPVGAPGWGDAVGQKVVWMATERQQVAELHLNPPSLGPLEVRLTFSNDQTSALFVSHHPAVREAIESALPRLREMLADSGIMLGNAMVSAESFSRQQSHFQENGQPAGQGAMASGGDFGQIISRGVVPLRSDGSGLVDIFA